MPRVILCLTLAATLANSPGACSKSSSSQSAAAGRSAGASGAGWTSLGATACAKYFTPDITQSLLSGPGTAKTLSAQSCSLETSGGNISVTLISDNVSGFDAFSKNLVDPEALPGVGDKAFHHAIGIAAYKAPSMVCTIDAVGAPGFLKQSGAQLDQTLGGVCNKLFAAGP